MHKQTRQESEMWANYDLVCILYPILADLSVWYYAPKPSDTGMECILNLMKSFLSPLPKLWLLEIFQNSMGQLCHLWDLRLPVPEIMLVSCFNFARGNMHKDHNAFTDIVCKARWFLSLHERSFPSHSLRGGFGQDKSCINPVNQRHPTRQQQKAEMQLQQLQGHL